MLSTYKNKIIKNGVIGIILLKINKQTYIINGIIYNNCVLGSRHTTAAV
jgi:hypothetical protein